MPAPKAQGTSKRGTNDGKRQMKSVCCEILSPRNSCPNKTWVSEDQTNRLVDLGGGWVCLTAATPLNKDFRQLTMSENGGLSLFKGWAH